MAGTCLSSEAVTVFVCVCPCLCVCVYKYSIHVCAVDYTDYCIHCVCVFGALSSLTVVCARLDEDSEGAVISPALHCVYVCVCPQLFSLSPGL